MEAGGTRQQLSPSGAAMFSLRKNESASPRSVVKAVSTLIRPSGRNLSRTRFHPP